MTLLARLDKTGTRVLCGVCGCELGLILPPRRELWLPPGWTIPYGSTFGYPAWYFSRARRPFPVNRPGDPAGWLPFLPTGIICRARRCPHPRQILDAAHLGVHDLPWPAQRVGNQAPTSTPEAGVGSILGQEHLHQYEEYQRRLKA